VQPLVALAVLPPVTESVTICRTNRTSELTAMVTIERRCIRLETIEPLDMGRLILSLSGKPSSWSDLRW
jgi:hypothetical protein